MNAVAPSAPSAPPALAAYLEALPEPHIVLDTGYRIRAANAAYRAAFAPQGPVLGQTCHAVSHGFAQPCDAAGESCPLARARRSGQREQVLHLHHTPRGEVYVQIELVPVPGGAGGEPWFVEKMQALPVAAGAARAQGLIGRAPAFRQMLELVARVGPSNAAVLLLGESGTGKELVARAVHEASPRAARPLVVVDCASLPETLFESELFGHEKGAFTGAHAAKAGLVETAHGGTLFLDEVGDIPLALQVKLLRLLESGTYRRVGGTALHHADVRLVSATHRDLHRLVAEGRFREDLLHRIGSFPIVLPPLRERVADIALLAAALLERLAPGRGLTLAPQALGALRQHRFPGNVRELRNVIERAALLCDGPTITAPVVEQALALGRPLQGAAGQPEPPRRSPPPPVGSAAQRRAAQRQALREALAVHGGHREALARALGLSLRTLYRRLAELQAD